MTQYMEALVLWLVSFGLFFHKSISGVDVCVILLSFSFVCFLIAVKQRSVSVGIGIVSMVACFLYPPSVIFVPVLSYIYCYHGTYLVPVVSLFFSINYFFVEGDNTWLVIGLWLLAVCMGYRLKQCNDMSRSLRELRDSNVEKEMSLKRSNQKLLESQNSEVYAATLKERNRIAREIHDNVGHSLSSSILQVGAMIAICKDAQLKALLTTLKATLDQAMTNIRNSVHDLHDESVDMETVLRDMIEQFTFCETVFRYRTSKHVDKRVKYCFIAIVKEALHNVSNHSNATKVTITVREQPGFYQLLIEDNGTNKGGFSEQNSGIGLTNMRDRVEALKGILNISNQNGFHIFISVPKDLD